jgi:hypothetical protein
MFICSHQTLLDFEIPILLKSNCEVFVVKKLDNLNKQYLTVKQNVNILEYYDSLLTIPKEDLNKLNNEDWYNNNYKSVELIDILNNYFDFIICTLLTDGNFLHQLKNNFKGKICFRFFGREHPYNYDFFFNKISQTEINKFQYWFSYQEVLDWEFKNHQLVKKDNCFIIPIGYSEIFINKYLDSWNSVNNRICFICSKVNVCGYYTNIYNTFEKNFSDFIKDDKVIVLGCNNNINKTYFKNDLDNEEFFNEIKLSSVMYYHSTEPRHLHYHPFEAIIIGIPVIFHSESLLSTFLPDSPGKCTSLDEVKEKIQLVLDKDESFISSILESQKKCRELIHPKNLLNIFEPILDKIKNK